MKTILILVFCIFLVNLACVASQTSNLIYKCRRRQTYSEVNILSLRKGKQNAGKVVRNWGRNVSRLSPEVTCTFKYDIVATKALFVTVQTRNINIHSKGIKLCNSTIYSSNVFCIRDLQGVLYQCYSRV
jgi:hypothetical protein